MFRWWTKTLNKKPDIGQADAGSSLQQEPSSAVDSPLVAYQVAWSQSAPPAGQLRPALLVSTEPDLPQPFWGRVGWFAVLSDDMALVARVLGLGAVQVANWNSGLKAACERQPASENPNRRVFVTPPLNGWVLVVGASLPYSVEADGSNDELKRIARRFDALMLRLASHFDQVQHFASQRTSGFVTWSRRTERTYRSFTYGDGWVYINRGAQTTAERELGMPDLTGMDLGSATEALFRLLGEEQAQKDALLVSGVDLQEAMRRVGRSAMPDENHVADIAGLWSIDPNRMDERFHEKRTGLFGVLNLDR